MEILTATGQKLTATSEVTLMFTLGTTTRQIPTLVVTHIAKWIQIDCIMGCRAIQLFGPLTIDFNQSLITMGKHTVRALTYMEFQQIQPPWLLRKVTRKTMTAQANIKMVSET